jgi:hypothetical protein
MSRSVIAVFVLFAVLVGFQFFTFIFNSTSAPIGNLSLSRTSPTSQIMLPFGIFELSFPVYI